MQAFLVLWLICSGMFIVPAAHIKHDKRSVCFLFAGLMALCCSRHWCSSQHSSPEMECVFSVLMLAFREL